MRPGRRAILGDRFRRLFAKARPRRQRERYLTAVLLGCAIATLAVVACGDHERRVPSVHVFGGAGGPGSIDTCASPNEGCPCEDEGTELDCGKLREQFDDYVTCQMGTRTCENGQWGACRGDRVWPASLGR